MPNKNTYFLFSPSIWSVHIPPIGPLLVLSRLSSVIITEREAQCANICFLWAIYARKLPL